jgi:hypothetical protein
MADRIEPMPQDRKAWLLEIARRLRADYEALLEPVPPRFRAFSAFREPKLTRLRCELIDHLR